MTPNNTHSELSHDFEQGGSQSNPIPLRHQLWVQNGRLNHAIAIPLEGSLKPSKQINVGINAIKQALRKHSWWLLGTVGCHLCEDAINLIGIFAGVTPIHLDYIDIVDFDGALMQQFATKIPVLISEEKTLYYPFSLADLQTLL